MKRQEYVLENPFHPLDLSPADLLCVFKRFEQSRIINRNPKQQLPIETIAQLISSLKGCKPSQIQKCMAQALIKDTISWNDFLMFLDQQSEVRSKILDWLIHQKNTKKYQYNQTYPIRRINKTFEAVTFLKIIQFAGQLLLLIVFDNKQTFLVNILEKFKIIGEYSRTNQKTKLQFITTEKPPQPKPHRQHRIRRSHYPAKRINIDNEIPLTSSNLQPQTRQLGVQQWYSVKQRKVISGLWNIFENLQIDYALKIAQIGSHHIKEKTLGNVNVSKLKQSFADAPLEKSDDNDNKKIIDTSFKHAERMNAIRLEGFRQKKTLSYNPYRAGKHNTVGLDDGNIVWQQKKIAFERKQKQYLQKAIVQTYSEDLKCMAIIYYNLQIVLLKISKQYNKIVLEEHDIIKIDKQKQLKKQMAVKKMQKEVSMRRDSMDMTRRTKILDKKNVSTKNMMREITGDRSFTSKIALTERDNFLHPPQLKFTRNQTIESLAIQGSSPIKDNTNKKKQKDSKRNQTVESLKFYHHSIVNKWILLVLIRSQFKTQYRNDRQAIVQGYQLVIQQCKRKHENIYKFHPSKQPLFTLNILGQQIIEMQTQANFGIHLISYDGKYYSFREQYDDSSQKIQYWKLERKQHFKSHNLSLSCLQVSSSLNKIIFGSISGYIIIYDLFSHQYKTKKISNHQILSIKINDRCAFIISQDEKISIYDLDRIEEIQVLSVKNEEKLHEKIFNFELHKNNFYCFGTELKRYSQYVDQSILRNTKKIQTLYTWRLTKLNQKKVSKITQIPKIKYDYKDNTELITDSKSYFIILSDILEAIVISKDTLKIKFTLILDIPYDSKVMKMTISKDQKLLCLLLFDESIYIFNIYTQELYLNIKSDPYHRFSTITFLDQRNQYLLAAGTDTGKICLIPYPQFPQKQQKILLHHKKSITLSCVYANYMITASEDGVIAIWQLPFNILKHEIKTQSKNFICQEIGFYGNNTAFVRKAEGEICQLDLKDGKIKKILKQPKQWLAYSFDSCTMELLGISKDKKLVTYKKQLGNQWKYKNQIPLQSKSKIIGIGVIQSEKALIFYQGGQCVLWSYQTASINKVINFQN